MSDKNFVTRYRNSEKDEEKILYGDNKLLCFACGEEIDNDTEICPYCKTNIK
ncbi:MAG: hypothetical protein ACFFEY_01010 [Candidatus Thorarchaeota archaeon]